MLITKGGALALPITNKLKTILMKRTMETYRNAFEAIMAQSGYKPKTTFWDDFTIADHFGAAAVQDTFNRAFNEWKDNTEYVTELVMVLNHKIWYYYEKGNQPLAALYDKLWKQADAYCLDNLKGADADYYYRTTD